MTFIKRQMTTYIESDCCSVDCVRALVVHWFSAEFAKKSNS